ncbi:CAP domain-containing protein [Ktedonospora formicarum]|uniref:SCP domain-containing protein n=1 Tax=Ktedonospora formicarum TaxID=2778364 RepID=A0A8J3MQQ3_9CHLR|nr:CAP domain-containing protein [Ktedonospora formicarum]GHO42853.1 hypothetical protein KSX_10160 [Ktedonospora formicarum]
MRKLLSILFALLLFSLAACGSSAPQPGEGHGQSTATAAPARKPPGTEVAERPRVTPSPKPRKPTPTPKPSPPSAPTSVPTQEGGNGGGSTSTPTSSPSTQLAQQLFALINQDRAANGLPALSWEPKLAVSALRHNQVMMGGCGLSHQCSGEAGLGDRETNAGVSWNYCGENIGTGGPVPSYSAQWNMASGLHRSMMNETPPNDGHRQNLLSRNFHRIGISISIDANNHLWLTEDFAN